MDTLERKLTWTAPGLWAMVAVHGGALLAFMPAARPSSGVLALALATYVVRMFCITAGFHRYFSHHAFQTSRALQFALAFVGGMGVMRSALWWSAHHRQHHRYSDAPGDPHSPRDGFWWSHLFWFMARGNQATQKQLVKDWTKYPELVWLDEHEWVPVLVLVAVCFGLGGFSGWVWGANVSTLLLCHSTFALNSVTHTIGSRKYDVPDLSTNFLPVALLAFGEGWHNNHHRYPERAKLGEGPQLDIAWLGIWLLERVRLVRGVKRART